MESIEDTTQALLQKLADGQASSNMQTPHPSVRPSQF